MITVTGRSIGALGADRNLGYVLDNKVLEREFYITDMSLFGYNFKIDYETPVTFTKGIAEPTKAAFSDGFVLTWLVEDEAMVESGLLKAQLRAFNPDGDEVWHSSVAFFKVDQSINAPGDQPDVLPSEFLQMEARVTVAKNAAELAATDALGSATMAGQKATDAAGAAALAATKATEAAGSATLAGEKAALATTKATEAAGSATLAGEKATLATTKATEAETAATLAGNKATEATEAATLAGNKATEAGQAATTATGAATTATQKASEAATSAQTALTRANLAGQAANDAGLSAQAAIDAALDAEEDANLIANMQVAATQLDPEALPTVEKSLNTEASPNILSLIFGIPRAKDGANGTNSQFFTGTAVTGTGTDISAVVEGSKTGDMYINAVTCDVYRASAANVWDFVVNIKGASGVYVGPVADAPEDALIIIDPEGTSSSSDEIPEGSTNLYHTADRAKTAIYNAAAGAGYTGTEVTFYTDLAAIQGLEAALKTL